ncbi:MAG: hypothetical protein WED05_11615 [Candidatus Atabeyarchaeum deiterrae]
MSTPAPDSGQQATKIRSIEVALNSFQSRVQASLSSHVETLKSKMEIVASKVNPSVSELNKPQLSVGDLRKVAEEIDRIVQKDLLEDTTKLINEKFVEFNGLVSRLRNALVGSGYVQQSNQVAPIRGTSAPSDMGKMLEEKDGEIASLREEINRLYNLTEREPRFQAFWVLRDAYPNFIQITKIAQTLSSTPINVHENLKVFESIGLVEVKGGEARALKLVRPMKPTSNK